MYKDVSKIELDDNTRFLQICSPMEIQDWDSPDKKICLDSTYVTVTYTGENISIGIPFYFDRFDEVVNELSSKTGLVIVHTQHTFKEIGL